VPHALPRRLQPMQPVHGQAPFDDPAAFFEPWWPGARMLAFVEAGRLRLQTEHLSDPLTAFPELATIRDQVSGDGVIVDGTLLVLDDDGRPDAELLRRRLGEGGTGAGEAAFVASDLVYDGGISIAARPFIERRERLADRLRDGDLCVVGRGLRGEGTTLAAAAASMGLDAISARRLEGRYRPGDATEDWQRLPVVETPARETRPLLTLIQRLPL
jgi:bifunctional non-homologous end joining protein LigD